MTVNFILFYLFILCFTAFPLFLASGLDPFVSVLIGGALIAIFLIFLIWVKLYYVSMWYELREDEMSWKRGVWFHTTGIVPYNRITNLDIKQGPVMRHLGISTLAIQTAGYSGQAVPEIRIEGMEHAEELRELLRSMVRQSGTHSDGTGGIPQTRTSTHQQMLEELVRIRTLLEQQK
jgi:membrane protein YdbS with pleckstrin-like domain